MLAAWQPSHLTWLVAVACFWALLCPCSAQVPSPGYSWQTTDGYRQYWGYSGTLLTANATERCAQSGGALLVFEDFQAYDIVAGSLWQTFWVGLRRPSDGADFQWADGSPLEAPGWGADEPRTASDGCAALSSGTRFPSRAPPTAEPLFLESADCSTLRPFICSLGHNANSTAAPLWATSTAAHPTDPTRQLAFAGGLWRTWRDAQAACQQAGGQLATINSDALRTALLSVLQPEATFLVATQPANATGMQPVVVGNARLDDGRVVTDAVSGLAVSNAPNAAGCWFWDRLRDTPAAPYCKVEAPCPQLATQMVCYADSVRTDPVEARLGSKSVLFFSLRQAFQFAVDKCASYNASLLVVESAEENAALLALAAVHLRGQPMYINGYGTNRTVDGRPLPYSNFLQLPAQLDGNSSAAWTQEGCVVVSPYDNTSGQLWPGAWLPLGCFRPRSFVCQRGNATAAGAKKGKRGSNLRITGAVSSAAHSLGISPRDFIVMITLLMAGALLTVTLLAVYCCCRRPAHPAKHPLPPGKPHADMEAGKHGQPQPPHPQHAHDMASPRDQPQPTCVGWPAGRVGCVGPVAGAPVATPPAPRTTSPWHKVLSWMDRHPVPLPPTQRDRGPPQPKGAQPQPPYHGGGPATGAGPPLGAPLALCAPVRTSFTHLPHPVAPPPSHNSLHSSHQHLQLAALPPPTHLNLATAPSNHLATFPSLHSARLHKSPSGSTSHSHSQLGVASPADLLLDSHSTAIPRTRWPSDPQLHEDPPVGRPHPAHASPKRHSTSSSHSWTSAATPSLEPPSTPTPRTDSRTPPERHSHRGGFTYHVNSLAMLSDSEWGSPRGHASPCGSSLALPSPLHNASEQWSSDSEDHLPVSSSNGDPPTPPHLAPFGLAYIRSMPWDITPGHSTTGSVLPIARLSPPSRAGSVHRSSCPTVAPSLHIQTPRPGAGASLVHDTTLPSPSFHITSAQEIIIHTHCKLGQGACGTVFRGEFRSASVAVKVIDVDQISSCKEAAEQERVLASYRQEIAVLSRINHPNILRMYGACMDPPKFLVVEELMHKSLATHIHGAPLGRLPLGEALRVGGAIACGLQHLHPFVVHRDLKPQNVLMSETGDVKIGDFGAARIKLDTYLTESAHMAGTVPYMAPECLRCDSGVSEKCDIYSLGVIIWEAVTGLKPWAGERAVGIIYRVALQGHRLLPPPTCPPVVAELIDRCLDFDPRNRPDAEEVVERVDTLLEHLDMATLAAPVVVIGGPPQTGERSLFPRAQLPPPDEISQELLRLQQLPFSRRGSGRSGGGGGSSYRR